MRTRNERVEDRRAVGVDRDDGLLELCRTLDDASERIAEALAPLEQIKMILEDAEKHLRRMGK